MVRKTEILVISDEGRDKGKRFLLTEMPAYQGIRWADKCLLALAASGANLPDGAMGSGMLGILSAGVTALDGLKYDTAAPLLEELIGCAQFQPSPNLSIPLLLGEGCPIEEVRTFWTLRIAIFKLLTGFSMAANGHTTVPSPGPTLAA